VGEKKKERVEWRTRKNTTTRRPNLWVRVGLQTQPPHTFTVWVIQKLGPQGGESNESLLQYMDCTLHMLYLIPHQASNQKSLETGYCEYELRYTRKTHGRLRIENQGETGGGGDTANGGISRSGGSVGAV